MPESTGSAEELARLQEELLQLVDDLLADRVDPADAAVALEAYQLIIEQIELDTDTRWNQLIKERIELEMKC